MLKHILLGATLLMTTSTVMAADITNPFYLPKQGKIGSITDGDLTRFAIKNDNANDKINRWSATETLQYGLVKNLALTGSIGNARVKTRIDNVTEKKSENIAWSAGLVWNAITGPDKLQMTAQYGQDRAWNVDGEYKYVNGEIKYGHRFPREILYISGGVNVPVAQKSEIDKLSYNAKIGFYQGQCETWALDTGLRLIYDENSETRILNAEVEASYYLTKNMTLGAYGVYSLAGQSKMETDVYQKTVSLRLRYFF